MAKTYSNDDLNKTRLWTAVITPFSPSGEIDFSTFKKLISAQEEAGNGVVVLGSTGEALNLSDQEKKSVVEWAANLDVKIPLMFGVGGHDLAATQEWLRYLEGFSGVHAYLVVTPLYAKPGDEGQYLWFKTLLDQASRPCMLYNVPGRTGIQMSLSAVERLNKHPKFWSIKEASGDPQKFAAYVGKTAGQTVFSGDDAMTPKYVPHGCHGLVSVASNVWPSETALFVKRALSSELNSLEIELWEKAANSLFLASNPIPVKALMNAKKMITSPLLRLPLTDKDLGDLAPLINADEEVTLWKRKLETK